MKNVDGMAVAMTLIGALMRRLGVEQADFGEKELSEVKGTVSIESLPGHPYVRIDLHPDAESVE